MFCCFLRCRTFRRRRMLRFFPRRCTACRRAPRCSTSLRSALCGSCPVRFSVSDSSCLDLRRCFRKNILLDRRNRDILRLLRCFLSAAILYQSSALMAEFGSFPQHSATVRTPCLFYYSGTALRTELIRIHQFGTTFFTHHASLTSSYFILSFLMSTSINVPKNSLFVKQNTKIFPKNSLSA